MRFGEHQADQPAHRMPDDQRLLQLLRRDIAVEIGDDPIEHAGLEIGPGIVAAKAIDLHQDDTVLRGKRGRDAVPHRARRSETGDEDDRAALAHRHDRDMRQPDFSRRRDRGGECGRGGKQRERGNEAGFEDRLHDTSPLEGLTKIASIGSSNSSAMRKASGSEGS